ncbi:MAG TPA: CCA tRNA nucleotidyltransferase, partial [Allocoleopsis sp.]
TAALLWHKHPELGSLWVDIATARTEFYPYPAANPEVEASSIKQDLYRRDFTINALALRLNPGNMNNNDIYEHQLLDFFGGLNDIENRIIRVLHPNSFIEDPTRIYRAVRFAVRLNFTIESQTEGYIKYAIASGIYHKIKLKKERAPALETRLKNELKYILTANYWSKALQLLGELGALTCIHSSLELNQELWWQIRFMSKFLQKIKRNVKISLNFPDWQIILELLIAHLKPEYRVKVAENLQFSGESISRLQGLENGENMLKEKFALCQYPSEIIKILKGYDLESLILIGARSTKVMRKIIWKYLTYWLQIKPPLNGHDLKIMGYKQGPNFKIILESLLLAIIDEKIGNTKEDAIAFIKQNFPVGWVEGSETQH